MVPLQLLERGPVAQHHPLGASTGYLAERPGDWAALVEQALVASPFAVELAALSERELPGLLGTCGLDAALPFHYLSVHAPVQAPLVGRGRVGRAPAPRCRRGSTRSSCIPTSSTTRRYTAGSARGSCWRTWTRASRAAATAAELAPLLRRSFPRPGFCFDVAHARDVDPSPAGAQALLDRFAGRLRHLHVSSLDAACHHVPLRAGDEEAFRPMLRRCRDVPWILEAPLTA